MDKNRFHEDLNRKEDLNFDFDKRFGYILSILFLSLFILALLKDRPPQYLYLYLSFLFSIISFFKPQILKPLYWVWMRFGHYLQKAFSPLVLAILYFFVFTPIAFFLKIIKKDLLETKVFPDLTKNSYWISAEKRTMSMQDQF